jgi:tRNA A-37 threonylcarbamoyl transferase component Bud32
MFESLRLKDLPEKNCGVLREPTSSRPRIWVVEENGVRAVVKDFSAQRFFIRNTMGRFLTWRESKAYLRLQHLEGVPALYRVLDGIALVIELIPGRTAEGLEKEIKLPGSFFDALKDLVDCVHRRGIAHCDLKRAANIHLGRDGMPYLLDWGAAISERELRFFPLNLVYRRFLVDDCLAITKLKLRHIPEQVSPAERVRYERRSLAERAVRALRNRLRRLGQRIA